MRGCWIIDNGYWGEKIPRLVPRHPLYKGESAQYSHQRLSGYPTLKVARTPVPLFKGGVRQRRTGDFNHQSLRPNHFPSSIFHFLLTLIFLLPAALHAQSIRSAIDSTQLLIGDQFHIDLWADIPAGSTVAWPQFRDTLIKTIEVVEATVPDTVRKENGDYTVHQRLTLTSFDTGFMVIPPVAFVFDGDTANPLLTDPELILVTEFPVDLEQDIMDIKGPMDVPFNWKKLLWWVLLFHLVVGAILLFLRWWKYRNRKPAVVPERIVPTRPAHIIALEKLEQLRLKKLWQSDRTKEYYIELSDIVREYIEFRYGIMALEQTTDETVRALKINGVDEQQIAALKGMLQLADLAKFAKYRPLSDENDRSMDVAKGFVESTRAVESKPDSGNKSDSN